MSATKMSRTLLTVAGALLLPWPAYLQATGYAVLHQFAGGANDGASPQGSLTRSGSTLYGMTSAGGLANAGTIFKINADGTGFAVLHSFAGGTTDGSSPFGSLTLSGSVLYGMTYSGGANNLGTVFKMNTDGTGYMILHAFAGSPLLYAAVGPDGSNPYGSLTISGTTLYGMTWFGGDATARFGAIFKINTDGTGFTISHAFAGGIVDGANPSGSLTLSGSTLVGMTANGGDYASGTIFQINADGTGYTILHSFGGGSYGANPSGSLTLAGSTLYGMTPSGGNPNLGTLFSMNTDGTGFSGWKYFIGSSQDGASPQGSLTLSGSRLFGMTFRGGIYDAGTIFTLTGRAILYVFGASGDGSQPKGDLTPSASGSTLYGMTSAGGSNGLGVVFAFTPSGPLIFSQPSDRQAPASGNAGFGVSVSGDATYQWQRQAAGSTTWTNLTDGGSYGYTSSATLGISPVSAAMNGDSFRCVVTNSFGSVTTAPATLTVISTPSITIQPWIGTKYYLSSVLWFTLTVSFTAAPTGLNVGWESSTDGGATWNGCGSGSTTASDLMSGIYTNTLTINVPYGQLPQKMSPKLYRCIISNAYGTTTSSAATISLGAAVDITAQPSSQTVTPGGSATFGVTATGWSSLMSYQWQRQAAGSTTWTNLTDGANYSGTSTATLTINPVTAAMNGDSFRCVIDNIYGEATTSVATLTSTYPITIKTQPLNQSPTAGGSATFTVTATSVPLLTYQWQRQAAGSTTWSILSDSAAYSGTSTATLTVNPVTLAMSGDLFHCVISNGYGNATSASVALVVPVPLTVVTFAGQAGVGGSTDGTGSSARFSGPTDVAVDGAGNVFVADTNNHTIRKITPAGVVSTVAGYAGASGSYDGVGSAARFFHPAGVAIDGTGNIYVADSDNETIRKITAAGVVTTVAGQAGGFAGSTDGPGSAARFSGPSGIVVAGAGNLYVADTLNHTLRMITPSGVVSTFAGAAGVAGSVDATGTAARFYGPQGLALDNSGNLYVADTNNATIRKVVLSTGVVTTVAGLSRDVVTADGPGSMARFYYPSAVTVDAAGNLYVTDTEDATIRAISPQGVVTTIAGQHGNFWSNADGVGNAAHFSFPTGITVDNAGNLYIADTNAHTIRLGYFAAAPVITIQPQGQTVTAGNSVQFSVTASGKPAPTYQWNFNGAAISGATSSTLSLPNVQSVNAGDYAVTVSNASGSVVSNRATLIVNAAPAVSTPSGGGGSSGGGGGAITLWFVLALALLGTARWTGRAVASKGTGRRAP